MSEFTSLPCPPNDYCQATTPDEVRCLNTIRYPMWSSSEQLCPRALMVAYKRAREHPISPTPYNAAWQELTMALHLPDEHTEPYFTNSQRLAINAQNAALSLHEFCNASLLEMYIPIFRAHKLSNAPEANDWETMQGQLGKALTALTPYLEATASTSENIYGHAFIVACLQARYKPKEVRFYPRQVNTTSPYIFSLLSVKGSVEINCGPQAASASKLDVRPLTLSNEAFARLDEEYSPQSLANLLCQEASGQSISSEETAYLDELSKTLLTRCHRALNGKILPGKMAPHVPPPSQLLLAEQLDPEQLITSNEGHTPHKLLNEGWRNLELALATPDTACDDAYFLRMRNALEAVIAANPSSLKYRDAARTLLAFEPLFRDRAAHIDISPQAVQGTYAGLIGLIQEISPLGLCEDSTQRGTLGELLTLAFLLKSGESKYYAYPASPREEAAYAARNHDLYVLRGQKKVSVQVKFRASSKRYDTTKVGVLKVDPLIVSAYNNLSIPESSHRRTPRLIQMLLAQTLAPQLLTSLDHRLLDEVTRLFAAKIDEFSQTQLLE